MSKKDERIDMEIENKKYKGIMKKNKDGSLSWCKYNPKVEGLEIMPHYYLDNPKCNHLDVYRDGQKVDVIETKGFPMAGILLRKGKIIPLPPIIKIIKDEKELIKEPTKSKIEIASEYIRKVKINLN